MLTFAVIEREEQGLVDLLKQAISYLLTRSLQHDTVLPILETLKDLAEVKLAGGSNEASEAAKEA